MLSPRRPYRFWERLPTTLASSEELRVERVLAFARVLLGLGALAAHLFSPRAPTLYESLAYVVFVVYVVHSLLVLILVQFWEALSSAFRLYVHSIDLVWPLLVSLLTAGPYNPFFVYFFFVLLAAAYRWGLREAVATACAAILFLLVEGIIASPARGHLQCFVQREFEANRFVMRAVFLLTMGFLMGYLAGEEKRLREETSIVARVVARTRGEAGLTNTLGGVLDEILEVFDAKRVLLAVRQEPAGQGFLWEKRRRHEGQETTLHLVQLEPAQRETYFFASPAHSWRAARRRRAKRGQPFNILALDNEGRWMPNVTADIPADFLAAHAFDTLLAVSFDFGEEMSGRLFLLGARRREAPVLQLRFLARLVRKVGPALYSVYLLRRLRSRAGALERARIARELHDSVIQSLIAAEMQVEVLRRQAAGGSGSLVEELAHIQETLRQEVLSVRELMQQMKPLELSPKQLLDYLAHHVEEFGRRTGISARFVCGLEEVRFPPRLCREIARIVQEALINVRKHSGARNVLVSLGSRDGCWTLVVDDDGCGFAFSGRLSLAELDNTHQGPSVIKERVRAAAGELVIESKPGHGARLEITIPHKAHG